MISSEFQHPPPPAAGFACCCVQACISALRRGREMSGAMLTAASPPVRGGSALSVASAPCARRCGPGRRCRRAVAGAAPRSAGGCGRRSSAGWGPGRETQASTCSGVRSARLAQFRRTVWLGSLQQQGDLLPSQVHAPGKIRLHLRMLIAHEQPTPVRVQVRGERQFHPCLERHRAVSLRVVGVRIPGQSGHRFHGNPATHSRPIRPLIPREAGHLFQGFRPPIPRQAGHPRYADGALTDAG
jgi:hypothetical protein